MSREDFVSSLRPEFRDDSRTERVRRFPRRLPRRNFPYLTFVRGTNFLFRFPPPSASPLFAALTLDRFHRRLPAALKTDERAREHVGCQIARARTPLITGVLMSRIAPRVQLDPRPPPGHGLSSRGEWMPPISPSPCGIRNVRPTENPRLEISRVFSLREK